MSSSEKKVWLYRYLPAEARWRFQEKETSHKPREGDYQPGTLAHVLVTKIQHHHDSSHCPNRIILSSMDDVDRLMDHIFGDSEAWTGRRWWGGDASESLTPALCGFFVLHDFMYDYMTEQSK